MQITLENYEKLLNGIRKTIAQTQEKIVKNVNRQKVEMSWQIGKEIEAHLKGKDKADYGKELFRQLAEDTAIAKSALYQMHTFFKTYPKLPSEKKLLSWTHYRSLIAVKDAQTREQIENLVIESGLGSRKLGQEISQTKKIQKNLRAKKGEGGALKLRVMRGKIFNYKISDASEIDLGFNIFVEAKNYFKSGEIVTVKKSGEKFSFKKSSLKSNQIYTYKAELERVVDGDTIHVKLDLGFKIKHREILRLAQINAPEAATAEGKKSSDFLKKILKDVPFLVVKTNRTDIYGRYVADVFFGEKGETDAQKVAENGAYLSQILLDKKLAQIWGSAFK